MCGGRWAVKIFTLTQPIPENYLDEQPAAAGVPGQGASIPDESGSLIYKAVAYTFMTRLRIA